MQQFTVRFLIALFGGAIAGLAVGLLGRWLFDAGWNVFTVASYGIIVGSMWLAASSVSGKDWWGRKSPKGPSDS